MGDAQTGLEDWGRRLFTAYRRHPGHRLHPAGRRPGRSRQRADELGPFLPPRRGDLRADPGHAVRRQPRVPRPGPSALPVVLRPARNGPAGIAPDLVYHFETGVAFFAVLDSTLAVSDPAEADAPGGLARRRLVSTSALGGSSSCSTTRSTPRTPVATTRPCGSTGSPSSTSTTSTWCSRATITPTCEPTRCAVISPRPSAGDRDDLRRLGRGGQVLPTRPPRLHRGRSHRDLDLSDDRDRRHRDIAYLPRTGPTPARSSTAWSSPTLPRPSPLSSPGGSEPASVSRRRQ